jgi:hypothetical protein
MFLFIGFSICIVIAKFKITAYFPHDIIAEKFVFSNHEEFFSDRIPLRFNIPNAHPDSHRKKGPYHEAPMHPPGPFPSFSSPTAATPCR